MCACVSVSVCPAVRVCEGECGCQCMCVCLCVCVFEQVNTWTKPPIGQHLVQAALRSEPFADAAYLPRHDALLLALHHRRQRASRGMWATPLTVCPSLPSMSGVGAQGLTGTAAYDHGRGCLNRLVPENRLGQGGSWTCTLACLARGSPCQSTGHHWGSFGSCIVVR